MQPILWQWQNLAISSYTVMMTLGLIAALVISLSEARRQEIRSALLLDALLAAVTIGILSARLGYVLINWQYFGDHTTEILQLWQGGLNWQFGLIGGSIGAWLIARRGASPWRVMDALALGAALGICFGWIGSYLSATAYGRELLPGDTFFFLAIDAPDGYGLTNPRWPTQLLGVAWAMLIWVILWITRRRHWPAGARYWLLVAGYSLGAFLIGFVRGDDMPRLGNWRIDQLLDALFFLVGSLQLYRLARANRTSTPLPSEAGSAPDTSDSTTPVTPT